MDAKIVRPDATPGQNAGGTVFGALNAEPYAQNDYGSVSEDVVSEFLILANDWDPDKDTLVPSFKAGGESLITSNGALVRMTSNSIIYDLSLIHI